MQDVFRRCAAVVLLRAADVCSPARPAESDVSGEALAKSEGRSEAGCGKIYQVLLVHKPRRRDAWQLPQGGAEGAESIEAAALRELFEETGITAEPLGVSKTVYQYSFPPSYRRFRPDNVCGQKVEFVIATPVADVAVTVDGDEIDGHVWALPEEIAQYIERKDYCKVVEKLVCEGVELLQSR